MSCQKSWMFREDAYRLSSEIATIFHSTRLRQLDMLVRETA